MERRAGQGGHMIEALILICLAGAIGLVAMEYRLG
jgi:hypothetical protein